MWNGNGTARRRSNRTLAGVALILALTPALTGCGDDTADQEPDAGSSGTTSANEPTQAASGGAGDTPVVALSGAEICTALTPESVGAALGVEVTDATPSDSSTPQCSYGYTNETGATSTLTVASMRPDDVGGRAGDEAFDYVVDINIGLASGTDVEQVDLDAGERATRISGSALHLGIVLTGEHLVTAIVPLDFEAGQADALVTAAADALG